MRVIGITGGIASGKSTISEFVAQQGYSVFDADACSREMTAENGAALKSIRAVFGSEFIKDNMLNRAAMSREVFESPEKLKMLENIIHPLVISSCKERMHKCAYEQLFFIDAPLLLESGMDSLCDEVWLVYAPERIRVERACLRSDLEPGQVRSRIKSQMPFYKKKQRASYIIDNGKSREAAFARTKRLIDGALKRAKEDEA